MLYFSQKRPLNGAMQHHSCLCRASYLGLLSLVFLSLHSTQAGSATWKLDPASSDWNTATNWSPETVPNGPADIATFALSNMASVGLSADASVDSIVFNPRGQRFHDQPDRQ